MTRVVKLPPSEVIIGAEKSEWRRMHPAEHAEMKAREQKDQELVQYRKVIFVELLLWLLIPLLGRNVREKKAKHWLCWGNAEKKRGKARRYDLAEGRVPKNNEHRVGAKSCGECGCH